MDLLDRQQADAAMDPIPIFDIRLYNDATKMLTILNQFKHTTEKNRRSSELDDLPKEIEFIPFVRVYKLLPDESVSSLNWAHWDAREMSFRGFWCFTKLQRSGEKVSRKTEDGETWSSRRGRGPKNGFPNKIWVDKLVIRGKAFHMLELTLNEENKKPTVALCKIWRTAGNSTVASPDPETPCLNVFSPGASSSTSQQVQEKDDEGITEMQIDQPQGKLEGIAQHHVVPSSTLSMSGYILVQSSDNGLVQSIGQDYHSTYQGAISFLHSELESFRQIALLNGDEAQKIASMAQNLASYFNSVLHNNLGTVREPESNRPSTSNSAQPTEAVVVGSTANPVAAPPTTPEAAIQDDSMDPDVAQLIESFSMLDDSYFNVAL